jgi:hypothetical protein
MFGGQCTIEPIIYCALLSGRVPRRGDLTRNKKRNRVEPVPTQTCLRHYSASYMEKQQETTSDLQPPSPSALGGGWRPPTLQVITRISSTVKSLIAGCGTLQLYAPALRQAPLSLYYKSVVGLLQVCYNTVMDKLFGSRLRTDALVAIGRLGTTYVSELGRLLSRRPIEVQRAVAALEMTGAVQTRRLGNVRVVELSRRFPEYEQLASLLLKMSERPLYAQLWKTLRRRPRAMGKAL